MLNTFPRLGSSFKAVELLHILGTFLHTFSQSRSINLNSKKLKKNTLSQKDTITIPISTFFSLRSSSSESSE